MTNLEFAVVLEKLAQHYRADADLKQIGLYGWMTTKEELRATIKSFGGKWVKSGMDDPGEYASIAYMSDGLGPLLLAISRNKVCKRIVTYDCEPIMSPEEEAEVLA